MEEYEKKHDHAVAEKETDIPKLTAGSRNAEQNLSRIR